MEDLTLQKAKELKELIKVTEIALKNIKNFTPSDREKEKEYDDKIYNLCISKHSDGSGIGINLSRYLGNEELIKVITETLEKQLNQFKHEFEIL